MAEDQLQQLIQGFRTRLQAELDAQLHALTEHQTQALDLVRQTAEKETEQRWASRVENVHAEWSTKLETEVEAARAEAQRRVAEEMMRVRLDAEQEAAETSARLRTELEEMRLTERRQADEALVSAQRLAGEALDAERRRVAEALEEGRRQAEQHWRAELDKAQAELDKAQQDLQEAQLRADQAARQAEGLREENQQAKEALDAERRRVEQTLDADRRRVEESARVELHTAQEELHAARRRADEAMQQLLASREERQRAEQALAAEHEALHAERVRSERAIAAAQGELDTERLRAEQAIAKAQTALESERERAEQAVAQARAALDADRRRAEQAVSQSAPSLLSGSTLLEDLRAMDAAASLSDALAAAVKGASRSAPRAALFIVNGGQLDEWVVPGLPAVSTGSIRLTDRGAGVLADVLRRNEAISTGGNGAGSQAPAFAALPPGRTATAVPLVLGGQGVAVLYADEGREGTAPASWRDAIQILASHASACLAHLTAVRTSQALRFMSDGVPSGPADGAAPGHGDDEDGARRYARLLLSEVRLYNEATVRLGRQHGDLLQRLRPEIDRARRMYEERVSMRQRDVYFQQELVQTLADGDPALLGRPAESSS